MEGSNVEPTKLDLISTDDLLVELGKRFDCSVFMGRKFTKQGPFFWQTKRRYFGDVFMAIGLAENMAAALNDVVRFNEAPTDGKGT